MKQMRPLLSPLLLVVVFPAIGLFLDGATAARQRSFENSRPRNHALDSTSADASRRTDRGGFGTVVREAAVEAASTTSSSLDGPVLDLTELAFQNCLDRRRTITFALPDEHTAKVEKWWAGGFGDRLLGMVTALYLAVLTESGFNVHWTWPYDIHDYFGITECDLPSSLATLSAATSAALSSASTSALPASSSSYSASSESSSSSSSSSPPSLEAVHRNTLAEHLWNYFTDGKFAQDNGRDILLWSNARHWEEIARHPSTRARVEALGIDRLDRRDMFKLGVDSLFRHPSRELLDAHARLLEEIAAKKRKTALSAGKTKSASAEKKAAGAASGVADDVASEPVVGVQIRTGGDGDGWKDPKRHPLRSASYCFALEAARLCIEDNVCSVFLTADSKKAAFLFESEYNSLVKEMRARQGKKKQDQQREGIRREQQVQPPPAAAAVVVVQTPGAIAHTDRSSLHGDEGSASQAWLKSMLDWWALKQADYLLISRSGFGETAAWASNARYVRRLRLAETSASGAASARDGDGASVSRKGASNFDDVVDCSFDFAEDAFL